MSPATALFDAFNARDLSQWSEHLAPNAEFKYPGFRGGVEAAREYNAPFLKAFSDLHFRYTSSVTSGKRTVTTLSATGTHDGPLVTPAGVIPATGRKIALDAVLIVTVNGSQIVKEETYWDRIEMMEQLGVAPA